MIAATTTYRNGNGNGNGNGMQRVQSSLASIGTLLGILMQTALAVWWAAGINVDVTYLKAASVRADTAIAYIDQTRFSAAEEKTYRAEINERLNRIEERVRQVEIRSVK